MKTNLDEYKEMMHDVRRALGSEKERLTERIEQLDGVMKMADMTDELLSQIDDLKEENERLSAENERLREDVQEKEMKLSELSKLSAGVAKKSSQDEVLKALRTFVNKSKRKKYARSMKSALPSRRWCWNWPTPTASCSLKTCLPRWKVLTMSHRSRRW